MLGKVHVLALNTSYGRRRHSWKMSDALLCPEDRMQMLKHHWSHLKNKLWCWNASIPHQKCPLTNIETQFGHKHVMWRRCVLVCSNVKMAMLMTFFFPMNIFCLYPAAASGSHKAMCYRKEKHNILEVKFKWITDFLEFYNFFPYVVIYEKTPMKAVRGIQYLTTIAVKHQKSLLILSQCFLSVMPCTGNGFQCIWSNTPTNTAPSVDFFFFFFYKGLFFCLSSQLARQQWYTSAKLYIVLSKICLVRRGFCCSLKSSVFSHHAALV